MLESILSYLKDETNREIVDFVLNHLWVVIGGISTVVGAIIFYFFKHKNSKDSPNTSAQSVGGNATASSGGIAIGGKGGNVFQAASGIAVSRGGDAVAKEPGLLAVGGDGGEAGFPFRPNLGAPSSLPATLLLHPETRKKVCDKYGIIKPGTGGDSHSEEISHNNNCYSLNTILKLIRIWDAGAISEIDALAATKNAGAQQWWELLVDTRPDLAHRATKHIESCNALPEGSIPPNIYP
ncbi:MAG: hypothetical protein R3D35_08545 [Nitratireductor sp.]